MKVNYFPSFTIRVLKLGEMNFSRLLLKLLLAQTNFVINNLIPLAFFAMTLIKNGHFAISPCV
jgi:hypothetical protein